MAEFDPLIRQPGAYEASMIAPLVMKTLADIPDVYRQAKLDQMRVTQQQRLEKIANLFPNDKKCAVPGEVRKRHLLTAATRFMPPGDREIVGALSELPRLAVRRPEASRLFRAAGRCALRILKRSKPDSAQSLSDDVDRRDRLIADRWAGAPRWPSAVPMDHNALARQAARAAARLGISYCTARLWLKTWPSENGSVLTPDSFAVGTGYEIRNSAELQIIAKRGRLQRLGAEKPAGYIIATRREHSRKPDCVRDEIALLFDGPRCEMFARSRHPGFEAWGNEIALFEGAVALAQAGLHPLQSEIEKEKPLAGLQTAGGQGADECSGEITR